MKPGTHITRQFDWFAITEDLDSLLGLVNDQPAFGAVCEVALKFLSQDYIELAVNEV
ncbi:MAG: hypothetical protein WBR10_05575 [Candidatus Acidiferrum sp.]